MYSRSMNYPFLSLWDFALLPSSIFLRTKLRIFGDGNQTRSFTYVNDTVEMLVKLMQSEYKRPLNIGTDNEITINELIKKVEEIFKIKINVEYINKTENDPMIRRPDLARNKKYVGDIKRTSLENGLKKMFYYYNSLYGKNI
jgi:nucleoside-diphosphate-sugar epimerase